MNKKIRILSLILGLLFTILPRASLYAEVKENPLTGAIKKPKIKAISQSMGNVSTKEGEGETALSKAESRNHSDIVKLLRQAGAINEPPPTPTVKSSISLPKQKSSKHTQ